MVISGVRAALLIFLCSYAGLAMSNSQVTGFERWLDDFRYELGEKGVNTEILETSMASIKLDVPARGWDVLPTERFLSHFLSPEMMAYAGAIQQQYQPLLKVVSQEYGVQERYLVGLLTVAAAMNENDSKYPVIDVLTAKAFKRGDVAARLELENALKLLEKTGLNKDEFIGNANGAFGMAGLKPSVFRRHAVDYNKDGVVDVWRASADTLATTANALRELGWHGDEVWGREISLPENFNISLMGINQQRNLVTWQELGVRQHDGSDLPVAKMQASIVSAGGRHYMVYNNYFTLLRWQRSDKFALAVALLSDALEQPENLEIFPFAAAD